MGGPPCPPPTEPEERRSRFCRALNDMGTRVRSAEFMNRECSKIEGSRVRSLSALVGMTQRRRALAARPTGRGVWGSVGEWLDSHAVDATHSANRIERSTLMDAHAEIARAIDNYRDKVVALSHEIHEHPELKFQEVFAAGILTQGGDRVGARGRARSRRAQDCVSRRVRRQGPPSRFSLSTTLSPTGIRAGIT